MISLQLVRQPHWTSFGGTLGWETLHQAGQGTFLQLELAVEKHPTPWGHDLTKPGYLRASNVSSTLGQFGGQDTVEPQFAVSTVSDSFYHFILPLLQSRVHNPI